MYLWTRAYMLSSLYQSIATLLITSDLSNLIELV